MLGLSMHGRISSTLPYHTPAGPTRILPIPKFKLYPIPNQPIHPIAAQCFTLPFLKPFFTIWLIKFHLFGVLKIPDIFFW